MTFFQARATKSLLFSLLLCFPCLAQAGQTYYISTQGVNSNNGSLNSPWGSLEYAVTVATAGDTIIIRGGTYFMNEVFIDRAKGRGGAPGQYLTIKNFPGEQPFLRYNSRRLIIWADYVRVEGLHLEMPWRCDVFGVGNEIVNNQMTGPQPQFGAIETGGTDVLIEGNHIEYDDTGGNTQDHGIYVHKGERITVRNNTIIGSRGYGIHLFDEHKSADPAEWAAHPFVIKDYIVEGNTVSNSQTRSGMIIAKGRGGAFIALENITVRNNTFFNNEEFGLFIRQGDNITVFNNTFYSDNIASVLIQPSNINGVITGASNLAFKNNIFVTSGERPHVRNSATNLNFVLENNLYNKGPVLVGISESQPIVADPLFVNENAGNFSLQATSPAIDKGVNVGLAFNGAAPDLGAFEFGLTAGAPGAPVLSVPGNNAIDISTTPILVWNPASGALTYHVQVATDTNFSSILLDQSGLTETTFQVTGLSNSGVYFWRVNATNTNGTSAWSPVWHFTTISAGSAPGAPVLSVPGNNAIDISTTPTLVWNASSGATTYQVQVSAVANFSSTVLDQSGLTETALQVTGLSNSVVYFWRVRATNPNGTSPWSPVWQFTTVAAALAAPALSSPEDNATNQPVDLDLVWNPVVGAVSYQIQIANESDFSGDIIGGSGLVQTSFHLSDLPRERTLYWRVNATSAAGTGPWSSVWQFTTEPVTSVETGSEIPVEFRLEQNFPNPFNPTTNITFDLPRSEFVSLKVYTLLGTEVSTLVSENLPAGKHTVNFDASNLSSGVFFYKLQTGSFAQTRKMLLVR